MKRIITALVATTAVLAAATATAFGATPVQSATQSRRIGIRRRHVHPQERAAARHSVHHHALRGDGMHPGNAFPARRREHDRRAAGSAQQGHAVVLRGARELSATPRAG